jgi:hypothetical protein
MSTSSRTLGSNSNILARIPGWLATGLISAILAFTAAFVGVQRGQSVTDTRLTTAERDINEVKQDRDHLQEQMIPRREFDAAMRGFERILDDFKQSTLKSLDEIKSDIKDIRNRQK